MVISTSLAMTKPTRPVVSLIVAALQPELGIGANGRLPWRLKKEIKYFRDVTSKAKEGAVNAVIMGRNTWESIPSKFRPLSNRLNIVLSRSYTNICQDGVLYYNSVDKVMETFEKAGYKYGEWDINKIFIIGGAQVYNSMIDDGRVDNLLLTNVKYVGEEEKKPVFDTFLDWDLTQWEKKDVSELKKFVEVEFDEGVVVENDYEYEYTMWERK